MEPLTILITINAATLVTIATVGWKVIRFFNRIEFKTDLMWIDYKRRLKLAEEEEN